MPSQVGRQGELHLAFNDRLPRHCLVLGSAQAVQNRLRSRQQPFAFNGQPHAAHGPDKQRYAQTGFKPLQRCAGDGRRQAKQARRSRQAPSVSRCNKDFDILKIFYFENNIESNSSVLQFVSRRFNIRMAFT